VIGEPAEEGRSLADAFDAMAAAGVTRFGSLGIATDDLEAAGARVEGRTGAVVVATLG
jgi:hypothetical protein